MNAFLPSLFLALIDVLAPAPPSTTEVPMDVARYTSLTPAARSAYLEVTVEALRWSPAYQACAALDAAHLGKSIDAVITETGAGPDAPMLMQIAIASMRICGS